AAQDAAAARRRAARIRLRPSAGAPRQQGRHLHPGALRRSEEEGLDGDQHEERLEAHLRVRIADDLAYWNKADKSDELSHEMQQAMFCRRLPSLRSASVVEY